MVDKSTDVKTWEDTVSVPSFVIPEGSANAAGIVDEAGLKALHDETLELTREAGSVVMSFAEYARNIAPYVFQARLHYRTGPKADQVDWAGRSTGYRTWYPSIIAEAGIPGSTKEEGSPAGRLAKAVLYQVSKLIDQVERTNATEKAVKSGRLDRVREQAESKARKEASKSKAIATLPEAERPGAIEQRVSEAVLEAEDKLIENLADAEKVLHGRAQVRKDETRTTVRLDPIQLAGNMVDQAERLDKAFSDGMFHDFSTEAMVDLLSRIEKCQSLLDSCRTAGQRHLKANTEQAPESPAPGAPKKKRAAKPKGEAA